MTTAEPLAGLHFVQAPPSPAAAESDGAVADLTVGGLCLSLGGRQILSGVSLAVEPGSAVALVGPNGAGKSTLLRACLRLVEPSAGRVRLLGEEVLALPPAALRRLRSRVGFVFQRHNLVPRVSALTNVVHGAQGRVFGPLAWHGATAPGSLRQEALHCLERVGLAAVAGQRADSLSGGQSQRVAIARVLMQRPEFIVADEPVASLDPAAGAEVMALFVSLVRAEGRSLLFTTHDLTHALDHADRIVALKGGEVVLDVPKQGVSSIELRRLYD